MGSWLELAVWAPGCGASYSRGQSSVRQGGCYRNLMPPSECRVQGQSHSRYWGTRGPGRGGRRDLRRATLGYKLNWPLLPSHPGHLPVTGGSQPKGESFLLSLSSTWFQGPCPLPGLCEPRPLSRSLTFCFLVSYLRSFVPAFAGALDVRSD